MAKPTLDRTTNAAGFTLVEMLVYIVIAAIVLGAIYNLLINQTRGYTRQREVIDARESVRSAGVVLSSEFRALSAAGGDLYAISATSVSLRSIRGSGIVCARHPALLRFGLWRVVGEITTTVLDSALLYAVNSSGPDDDEWRVVDLTGSGDGGGWGVPTCEWPGSPATEQVIGVTPDTAGVALGAAVRAFRPVQYQIFQQDGRWWLGRQVGNGSLEVLTGPLRAPTDGGLEFEYFDAVGNPTLDRLAVRSVRISIRSESYGKARSSGSNIPEARRDSAIVRVMLRG